MRKFLVLFLLYPMSLLGDPFYVEENAKHAIKSEQDFENHSIKLKICQPPEDVSSLMLDIDFDKLTLIGLIKLSNHYKALFIDENKKLYDFSENQYFPFSYIQIKNIDLKQMSYIDWGKSENCQMPIIKTIKL